MGYSYTIVCLANSRKPGGTCVAGKEFADGKFGGWVRPISSQPSEALSPSDRFYKGGGDPQLLDLIHIRMTEPRPEGFQTENHLIDSKQYWSKTGRATWKEIGKAVDETKGQLWSNESSTTYGTHDRVLAETAKGLKNSLLLVRPSGLVMQVKVEGGQFGKPRKKVRARFKCGDHQYCLSVTDAIAEALYMSKENGDYSIEEALLCVSLATFDEDGNAYKLVAGVILPK